ncbi:unnamed protein product [Ambrosiozyma monospora]|uniref:Unnamed protein product n=1 Tax=Ambrosiozyma monospora TaxID=43982 RepID=A0ACB5T097_AMBMO|nr:unnamed protein product [Ambrosiozyma monospora]
MKPITLLDELIVCLSPVDITPSSELTTPGLPSNWTIRISKTHNQEYYYNKKTNESQWLPPTGTDEGKLQEYLKLQLQDQQK